ncbi:MAG: DNA repair protein RecO [Anaeromyxobacter sp. RBG_16_69_14]|nr:MAG: DNA repair protein RecO [Anaeromyxobacter sp. RBG_16_69_14]
MSDPLKLTGVVLRTVDYGESDRVVALFTEERGKVSAFARGARASRRRFGGALEPFTLLRAEARERRSADLLALESVSVVRGFGGIRGDLARIACASYACDLARALVRDAEPHPQLMALLVEILGRLDIEPARPTQLRAYELGALQAAGLMPRFSNCARCGGALGASGSGRLTFDPAEGGALCEACASAAPPGAGAPRLARATADALARLQAGGLAAAAAHPMSPGEGVEAREALSRFIEHHLGRRLASRKFLDEIGPLLG